MGKTKGMMAELNVFEVLASFGAGISVLEALAIISVDFMGASIDPYAPILAMVFILLGYVSGEVRSFKDMVDWEYLLIGVMAFLLAGLMWIPEVQDFILGASAYKWLSALILIAGYIVLALRRD